MPLNGTEQMFQNTGKSCCSGQKSTFPHWESGKSSRNKAFRWLRRSVKPCGNLTLILSIHSEVTHPLLRLLLPVTGSTFKSLGQRQDEERERIFVRPPLPGHESRGTTGVTTPDNQRGILNFHKVKARVKKKGILLLGANHQVRLCRPASLPQRSFAAEVASTVPTDRQETAAAARADCECVKQIWAKK